MGISGGVIGFVFHGRMGGCTLECRRGETAMASERHGFGAHGEWWVIAQGILFLAAAVAPKRGAAWSSGMRRAGKIVGVPVAVAGLGLTAAGFRALGENLTALPHPKDDATLVRDGVYGIVRHPIYGGIILTTLGAGLATANTTRTLLGGILALFFDAKARREEAWLVEKFPDYPDYRRTVKKLIPRVY
jgi:protein-S-isoprenylcysteine O-methyltransferase Ste14